VTLLTTSSVSLFSATRNSVLTQSDKLGIQEDGVLRRVKDNDEQTITFHEVEKIGSIHIEGYTVRVRS